eukprot:XP_006606975.1 two-component response regulator ARR12 [Glycine max]
MSSTPPIGPIEEQVGDHIEDMLRDLGQEGFKQAHAPYYDTLDNDSKIPLFIGCTKYTRLSAVLALVNLKARFGHEFAELRNCPTCEVSRYKVSSGASSEVGSTYIDFPSKVCWYLLVIPRFKRLFANVEDAKNLTWHADGRTKDGLLRHPADSPQWKKLPLGDRFPVGMRVVAVDDDQMCLTVLENLIHKCHYNVTTTNQAIKALEMLRKNINKFDLLTSDVNMPDMDGLKLLELVGLQMGLPVIMLSAYNNKERVMRGVIQGACEYLTKPVRIEELQNIWQHVLRRRIARLVWDVELHRKFLVVVNDLGIDSEFAFPKRILDLMNGEGLTRENVASHLQM